MNYALIILGVAEECIHIVNQLLLMYLLNNCKCKIDYKVIISAVVLLTFSISFYVFKGTEGLTLIINLLVQFFVFMMVVDINIKGKLFYFMETIIIQGFLQLILQFICKLFTKGILKDEELFSFFDLSIAIMLFLIILLILYWRLHRIKNNKLATPSVYMHLYLIVGLFTGTLVLLVVTLFGAKLSVQLSITLICLSFLSVFTTGFQYITYLKRQRENDEYKVEVASMELLLDLEEKHIHDLVDSYKDLRRFRHDVNGYLNTINRLIEENNIQGLKLLTKDLGKSMNSNILNKCNNIFISATLNHFLALMDSNDIEFLFEYKVLAEINMKNNEICSLFYNLMSNAVEAAMLCKENRIIKLNISNMEESLLIIISNSVKDNFVLTDLVTGQTSKDDKKFHGLGLLNIQHIVDIYHGRNSRNINNELFETSILLFEAVKVL